MTVTNELIKHEDDIALLPEAEAVSAEPMDYEVLEEIKRDYKRPVRLRFADIITVQCVICMIILLGLVASNLIWPEEIEGLAAAYKLEINKDFQLPKQVAEWIIGLVG